MAALPYIKLFVSDYLADTAHLTAAQHGAYLLLIFNYWQRGHALNNSNERLANVARMSSEDWTANKHALSEFFQIDGDEWVHQRIEADLAAVSLKSSKSRLAGEVSASVRSSKRKRTLSERPTNVERTSNHTDTDTDTDKILEACVSVETPSSGSDDEKDGNPADGLRLVPAKKIVEAFARHLPMLPQPRKMTTLRKRKLKARWCDDEERQNVEWWERYFAHAAKSDFLTGRDGRWPGCHFEWLLEEKNMMKVIEGNYDNRDQA